MFKVPVEKLNKKFDIDWICLPGLLEDTLYIFVRSIKASKEIYFKQKEYKEKEEDCSNNNYYNKSKTSCSDDRTLY